MVTKDVGRGEEPEERRSRGRTNEGSETLRLSYL